MPSKILKFCPLGGSGEIGMNMNLFGYGSEENFKWIIVDIGVTFADDSIPGIDLIFPDPGFIIDKKKDLMGIVITHAHEDHIGAIAHIWPKLLCNIYATPFTSVLIKEKFKEKKINIEGKLKIVQLNGLVRLGDFNIEYVTLTHSILEPNGLYIKTPIGAILHTGDWKCDPNPLIGQTIDEKKLKQIGKEGVIAMICDSTNVFSPGRAGSEQEVRDSLIKIMKAKNKRIVVTSFASNVARMETMFYCAKKLGRKIALIGRSMNRIYKAAVQCGYLKDTKAVDPKELKNASRNKVLYLCTGSQGEPNGAMTRVASGIHPDVLLESEDTVIFSSKIIPGNEKKLFKLHNQLVKNGIEVVSEENAFVHVSGHPNREDLKDMYRWVKPNSIIPVHGEHRHMMEHIKFAKEMQVPFPLQVENGDIVQLYPGNSPKIVDKAPTGKVYLDGNISVSEDFYALKERKKLANSGFLEVTIILDRNGKIIKKPVISFKGIAILEDDKNDFIIDLEDKIYKTCRTFSTNNIKQENNLIDTLKINCRKTFKEKTGKKPYTNINLVRI